MRFEWDSAKSRKNQEKHGISFEEAVHIFLGNHVCFELNTTSVERRWAIIGLYGKKSYTGIYTIRSGKKRLISFRRSRKNEELYYEQYFK